MGLFPTLPFLRSPFPSGRAGPFSWHLRLLQLSWVVSTPGWSFWSLGVLSGKEGSAPTGQWPLVAQMVHHKLRTPRGQRMPSALGDLSPSTSASNLAGWAEAGRTEPWTSLQDCLVVLWWVRAVPRLPLGPSEWPFPPSWRQLLPRASRVCRLRPCTLGWGHLSELVGACAGPWLSSSLGTAAQVGLLAPPVPSVFIPLTSSFFLPARAFLLPVLGFFLPALGFLLFVLGFLLPVLGFLLPVLGFLLPVLGFLLLPFVERGLFLLYGIQYCHKLSLAVPERGVVASCASALFPESCLFLLSGIPTQCSPRLPALDLAFFVFVFVFWKPLVLRVFHYTGQPQPQPLGVPWVLYTLYTSFHFYIICNYIYIYIIIIIYVCVCVCGERERKRELNTT